MDRIEHVHRFTRAVSVGNPREFLQAEKEDQEMAEACKRLIKNCIICWNYLYLSQKMEEIEDAATRQVFLDAVAHGSVISWQHINLLGEYDFSDEKLQDNVGIRPPKLTPKEIKNFGAAEPRYVLQSPGLVENCVGLYVPLLQFNQDDKAVKVAHLAGTMNSSNLRTKWEENAANKFITSPATQRARRFSASGNDLKYAGNKGDQSEKSSSAFVFGHEEKGEWKFYTQVVGGFR